MAKPTIANHASLRRPDAVNRIGLGGIVDAVAALTGAETVIGPRFGSDAGAVLERGGDADHRRAGVVVELFYGHAPLVREGVAHVAVATCRERGDESRVLPDAHLAAVLRAEGLIAGHRC